MKKVNILYIIDRMGPGGSEKQLYLLINGLTGSTMTHAHLATLKPSENLLKPLFAPAIELSVKRLIYPATVAQLVRLIKFCRHHKINLIQTFFQDSTIVGAILKAFLPVKLVISFRDMGFWRTRRKNLKMRMSYPWADGFIANSFSVRDHFTQTDKIPPGKIEVIPNGFENHRIINTSLSSSLSEKKPVIGIVGNFNRAVKRMGDFIEAAAMIKRRHENAKFVIVGDGNQKAELVQRCKELGIFDSVTFTGRIADPLEQIQYFTVGVNTSGSEGFSNAVIEYMACGLPVVVTDVDGNRELVQNGVNGFRVPVGDAKAIAEHVVNLIENPNLSIEFGRNNIHTVRGRYSMQNMVEAHEIYYRKILSQ